MESIPNPRDALADLAKEYWEERMRNEPLFATALGDRRFDERLPDISPQGRKRMAGEYEDVVRRCGLAVERDLADGDRITKAALLVDAGSVIEYLSCGLDDWVVDPLQGIQVELMNLESYQPVHTVEEGLAMVKRWRGMRHYVDQHVANLRSGVSEHKVSVRATIEKVIDELDEVIAKPDSEWALLRPLSVDHPEWTEEERLEFRVGLEGAVRDSARPALAGYLAFLRSELLPKARPQEKPGVMHIPGGEQTYEKLIRVHTSLVLTPARLHETGMNEVARINGEMERLGEKVFGTRDRRDILRRLRTDPSLYFSSRDEVAAKAESALARAHAPISKWLGRLP